MTIHVAGTMDCELQDVERFFTHIVWAGPDAGHDQGQLYACGGERTITFTMGLIAPSVVHADNTHVRATPFAVARRLATGRKDEV